jgi:hypothetical protein
MELILTDPIGLQKKKVNFIDQIFLPLINDKRDMAFIYLSLKITCFASRPAFIPGRGTALGMERCLFIGITHYFSRALCIDVAQCLSS